MKVAMTFMGGAFILILAYYFFSNPMGSVAMVNAVGNQTWTGVKVLQGRG